MTVPIAPGYPDYTATGSDKRIPWIWAKMVNVKYYDKTFISEVTNNKFVADINDVGDKVIIQTRPDVTIKKLPKGAKTDMEFLTSPSVEFNLDRSTYWYFGLSEVDMRQFNINMLNEGDIDAAEKLKKFTEQEFLTETPAQAAAANQGLTAGAKTAAFSLGTSGTPITLSKTNILDYLVSLQTIGEEQNWPEEEGANWIILPPIFCNLIQRSDLKGVNMTGDSETPLRRGRLGILGNMTIYKSNLYTSITDGGKSCYNLLFGNKDAVCFGTKIISMDHFEKLENFVGQAMRGVSLYGFNTVKPEGLGVLYATYALGL